MKGTLWWMLGCAMNLETKGLDKLAITTLKICMVQVQFLMHLVIMVFLECFSPQVIC